MLHSHTRWFPSTPKDMEAITFDHLGTWGYLKKLKFFVVILGKCEWSTKKAKCPPHFGLGPESGACIWPGRTGVLFHKSMGAWNPTVINLHTNVMKLSWVLNLEHRPSMPRGEGWGAVALRFFKWGSHRGESNLGEAPGADPFTARWFCGLH